MDITFLQKNYILVPASVVFAVLTMYAISLATQEQEKQKSYIKTSVVVALVVAMLVYIHRLVPTVEEVILSPPPF
jgi:hypothetical protein